MVDKSRPTTGSVSLTPNPANETIDAMVSAFIADPTGVTAAEFYNRRHERDALCHDVSAHGQVVP